jgi:hypothetical protein
MLRVAQRLMNNFFVNGRDQVFIFMATDGLMSLRHSTVAFGPQSFCFLSNYFAQYGVVDDIARLQLTLNSLQYDAELHNCCFTRDARYVVQTSNTNHS